MGDDESGFLQVLDEVCHYEGLATSSYAQQRLLFFFGKVFDQLGHCFLLPR